MSPPLLLRPLLALLLLWAILLLPLLWLNACSWLKNWGINKSRMEEAIRLGLLVLDTRRVAVGIMGPAVAEANLRSMKSNYCTHMLTGIHRHAHAQ